MQSVQNQSEGKKLDNIRLSDGTTKLLDLLSAMSDCDGFSKFLRNLTDVNAVVPHDSPFWPGCGVLHLAVMKGTRFWVELLEKLDPLLPMDLTKESELKYQKRIDLCLSSGCSVMMKNAEGVTPIHLAFNLHDKQITDLLLSRCDDNLIQSDHISFLHIACATGNADVVKRLLEKGADINSQTSVSFEWFTRCCSKKSKSDPIIVPIDSTALHIAAICQNKETVDLLLAMEANIYAQNALELTAIHLSMISSCRQCDEENKLIAQLLFKKAPILRESVSNSGISHLHVAAYADDANAIEKLLQMGADIDRVFKVTEPELSHLTQYSNRTPLHVAILQWSRKAILTLVKNGADILQQTSETATPLQTLAQDYSHSSKIIDCIKDKLSRIDLAIDVNGTTALHVACHTFDFEWAKELLENGADANAQILKDDDISPDWTGHTPMHILIKAIFDNGHEDRLQTDSFVELLIEHGAHPLTLSHDGQSALLLAHNLARTLSHEDTYYKINGRYGAVFLSIADMLLKNQPSYKVNPANSHGFTHFHYACMRNEAEVVEKFLDNGIDVNHTANITLPGASLFVDQDATNFTPLHFAAYYQSVEVARLLVERGANVDAVNKNRETPLHLAIIHGPVDLNLIEMLLSNGAGISSHSPHGRSPIVEFLLHAKDITHQQLKFFRSHGLLTVLTEENYGLIGSAVSNAETCDREAIFEEIIDYLVTENATTNYNLIENIVDIDEGNDLDLGFYMRCIQRLIDMGCNINQQNRIGETALHKASEQNNVEAIEALLLLGANINVVDMNDKPAIDKWYPSCDHGILTSEMLAAHVWKMKLAGLQVHELCETNMRISHRKFPLDENFMRQCEKELDVLSKERVGQSLNLRSFLREWGPVTNYPTMSFVQRECVDKFFANVADLRKKFPQFSGLLMMQYRRALDRLEWHRVAMDLLPSKLPIDMPYLCLENVLKYFDNDELKFFGEDYEEVDDKTQAKFFAQLCLK